MTDIQDFGDKVYGAKKTLWAERYITKTDLEKMSEKEMVMRIDKKLVWPEPDYIALQAEGVYVEDLAYIKYLYRYLGSKPTVNTNKTIAEYTAQYVMTLSEIRESLLKNAKEHTLKYGVWVFEFLYEYGYITATKSWTDKIKGDSVITKTFLKKAQEFYSTFNSKEFFTIWTENIGPSQSNRILKFDIIAKITSLHSFTANKLTEFLNSTYISGFPNVVANEFVGSCVCRYTDKVAIKLHDDVYIEWTDNKEGETNATLQANCMGYVAEYLSALKTKLIETANALKIEGAADITWQTLLKGLNVVNTLIDPENTLKRIVDATQIEQYVLTKIKGETPCTTNNTLDASLKKKIVIDRVALPSGIVTRTGPLLHTANINPNDMIEGSTENAFAFRGGEFGNWQNNRQECLNCAYDAFSDLAYVLDIPYKALAFTYLPNRTDLLTLAWGSRGAGKASAHYEPDTTVINLTKTKGAGSLAHEWGHAIDHALGKYCGVPATKLEGDYLSSANVTMSLYAQYYAATILNDTQAKAKVNMCFAMTELMHNIQTEKPQNSNSDDLWHNTVSSFQRTITGVYDKIKAYGNTSLISTLEGIVLAQRIRSKWLDYDIHSLDTYFDTASTEKEKCAVRLTQGFLTVAKQLYTHDTALCRYFSTTAQYLSILDYSPYYYGAVYLDGKHIGKYYSKSCELFARAFESYVEDKLGFDSQYLVHGTKSNEIYKKLISAKAIVYPEGTQRTTLNVCFDNLFAIFREQMLGTQLSENIKMLYVANQGVIQQYFKEDAIKELAKKKAEQPDNFVKQERVSETFIISDTQQQCLREETEKAEAYANKQKIPTSQTTNVTVKSAEPYHTVYSADVVKRDISKGTVILRDNFTGCAVTISINTYTEMQIAGLL